MSLSATLFGRDSLIFKATNVLGLGIPGWLDKKFGAKGPEAQFQSIGELSQQTAKESEPRAIIWGRVRPIGGNIIHCQKPITRWLVTYTEVEGGGGLFGGKKKKQENWTQHVYRTYAIGVCEGPITAFARIWRNNKLVYDGRGTAWGAKNNGVFLKAFRLYLGGWDQMPSPDLQAVWGAANVPAYRGTAYMVAVTEDLSNQGGAVPQWLFEVERAEGYILTSKPYAAELIDGIDVDQTDLRTFKNRELLKGANAGADSLLLTPEITGFALRDTTGLAKNSEALELTPQVVGMVIRSTVLPATGGSEGIDLTPNVEAMVIRESVVSIPIVQEAISLAHTVQAFEVRTI